MPIEKRTQDNLSTVATLVTGAEVTTTNPQFIAAAEIQEATPATDGTFANAKVPDNSQALTVPPIVPLSANETLAFLGVKPDIKDMTLDEKFACLKQCFAYGYGVRKVLCEVFESIRAEVKTYAKDRKGMPTVEEAFKQRGLNYHTVYSAIQREKDRRAEDAQFFAAIKAQASTKNIHGLNVTDDDLPPVGEKVLVKDGRKGVLLTQGVTDGGKSAEVYFEDDGTTETVKAKDLVILADVLKKKQEEKAAKQAAKNTPEAQKEAEEKETARIAAAAAKEDAAVKSADFYKEQYFALVALINRAPKEMTAAEFAQTVNDNLRVAYESLNAEEAKLIKPLPPPFPSFKGTKGLTNLIDFLSADAVGRTSPLKAVFGDLDKVTFMRRLNTFMQAVRRMFYKDSDVFLVSDSKAQAPVKPAAKVATPVQKAATPKTAVAPPSKPDQPQTTKVGDKSTPTAHGLYWEFIKDAKPYAVKDADNPNLDILCKFKGATEALQYINDREREAAEAARTSPITVSPEAIEAVIAKSDAEKATFGDEAV